MGVVLQRLLGAEILVEQGAKFFNLPRLAWQSQFGVVASGVQLQSHAVNLDHQGQQQGCARSLVANGVATRFVFQRKKQWHELRHVAHVLLQLQQNRCADAAQQIGHGHRGDRLQSLLAGRHHRALYIGAEFKAMHMA